DRPGRCRAAAGQSWRWVSRVTNAAIFPSGPWLSTALPSLIVENGAKAGLSCSWKRPRPIRGMSAYDCPANISRRSSALQTRKDPGIMQRIRNRWPAVPTVPLACVVFGSAAIAIAAEPDKDAMIRDALSAAPPAVASTAKVVTMDNKVLKEGT